MLVVDRDGGMNGRIGVIDCLAITCSMFVLEHMGKRTPYIYLAWA